MTEPQNPTNNATPPATEIAQPEWLKNPPPWLTQPPANNAGAPAQPVGGGPSRTDLHAAINELPEKIVNSLREAFPASPAAPAAPAAPVELEAPAVEQAPGKSKSFADWWWNG